MTLALARCEAWAPEYKRDKEGYSKHMPLSTLPQAAKGRTAGPTRSLGFSAGFLDQDREDRPLQRLEEISNLRENKRLDGRRKDKPHMGR